MKQNQVDKIIKYFQACRDEIEEEMKSIRSVQQECYDQYLCQKDFGDKEDWQFKTYIPISKPKIKTAVRLIKGILIGTRTYFDFDHPGTDETQKKRCNVTRRGLKIHLQAAKFLDTLAETLESGFTLSQMVMKLWVGDADKHFSVDTSRGEVVYGKTSKLKCKAINPFNFMFSRDGQIVIEDEWTTLPELRKMASQQIVVGEDPETGESITEFLYDQVQFKKILKGDYGDPKKLDELEEQRLLKLNIHKQDNTYRKDVLLSHFWGPLINKKNEVLMENCHFIVVNLKHLILLPSPNPFWHKKPPYVWGSPLNVLFRHVGKGLTEDVRGIEDAINDFVNLQMDNAMWQSLGVREIDPRAVDETGKATLQNLKPGSLLKRRSSYDGDMFRFHELGTNPDKQFGILSELKNFHEDEHGVTQYVGQQPGMASEKASIYAGKKQQAMSNFQSIAIDIERNFLVDCIDMARDLMLQFLSDFDSSPNMQQIFQQDGLVLDQLSPEDRINMIVTEVDIIGRGISVFFDKMEKIEKLGSFVKMVNAIPPEGQMYIPWDQLIKEFFEAFAFEKIRLKTDEEVAQMQAQMQQAQQQQQQMAVQQFLMQMDAEREKQDKELQFKMVELQQESQDKAKDRVVELAKVVAKD